MYMKSASEPVNIELVLLVPVHKHPPCLEDGQRLGVGVVEQVFVILFGYRRLDLNDLFMNNEMYNKFNVR